MDDFLPFFFRCVEIIRAELSLHRTKTSKNWTSRRQREREKNEFCKMALKIIGELERGNPENCLSDCKDVWQKWTFMGKCGEITVYYIPRRFHG